MHKWWNTRESFIHVMHAFYTSVLLHIWSCPNKIAYQGTKQPWMMAVSPLSMGRRAERATIASLLSQLPSSGSPLPLIALFVSDYHVGHVWSSCRWDGMCHISDLTSYWTKICLVRARDAEIALAKASSEAVDYINVAIVKESFVIHPLSPNRVSHVSRCWSWLNFYSDTTFCLSTTNSVWDRCEAFGLCFQPSQQTVNDWATTQRPYWNPVTSYLSFWIADHKSEGTMISDCPPPAPLPLLPTCQIPNIQSSLHRRCTSLTCKYFLILLRHSLVFTYLDLYGVLKQRVPCWRFMKMAIACVSGWSCYNTSWYWCQRCFTI